LLYLKRNNSREHFEKIQPKVFILWNTTGSGIDEHFPGKRFYLGMCDKCAQLDKKIEHYETMLVSIGDRATVERLMALVAELQARKAALHPEQKQ